MKIDRLVAILVVLLGKERVQAKDLAQKIEVSVRTILRDVEAINQVGIPIVTQGRVNLFGEPLTHPPSQKAARRA